MEDLFQIIIIVIFILSSIVSSMKKKKKAQNKASRKPVKNKNPELSKNKKSSSDILEEILGMKIELPEPQPVEVPVNYSEDSTEQENTWDPEKDYAVTNNNSEIDYKDVIKAKKSELLEDKLKYKATSKSEVYFSQVKPKITKAQKLFSNASSLKDYIIIHEILDKPKALRR